MAGFVSDITKVIEIIREIKNYYDLVCETSKQCKLLGQRCMELEGLLLQLQNDPYVTSLTMISFHKLEQSMQDSLDLVKEMSQPGI